MARLVVYFDRNKVGHYDFDGGRIRVGRHPESDIFLPHQSVSRLHVALVKEGDQWHVENAGGRNAIFVNGSVMKTSVNLSADDRIEFGRYIIRFIANPGDDVGSEIFETRAEGDVLEDLPTQEDTGSLEVEEEAGDAEEFSPLAMAEMASRAGVTASSAAPKPTGMEDGEGTKLLTLDKLRALRSRADKLNRPHLTWREGREERLLNLTDKPVFIGSSEDAEVCIPGGLLVAAEHARIVQMGETYEISPCSWFGKLRVNDEPVKDAHVLCDGDKIQIGQTELEFRTSMFEEE